MAGDRQYIGGTDPSIRYFSPSGINNPWTTGPGAAGKEFNAITTRTAEAGAAADISFYGTEIAVYATVGSIANAGAPPSISFTIDGNETQTMKPPGTNDVQYDVKLYQSRGLKPAQHNLRMSIVASGYIWLDYCIVRVDSVGIAANAGGDRASSGTSRGSNIPPGTTAASDVSRTETNPTLAADVDLSSTAPTQMNGQDRMTSLTSQVFTGGETGIIATPSIPTESSVRDPSSTITPSSSASSSQAPLKSSDPSNRRGIIAGLAALGGVLCFVSFLMLIWFLRRRRAKCRSITISPFCESSSETAQSPTGVLAPFRIPDAVARAGGSDKKSQRRESSAHLLQHDDPPEYPGFPT